MKPTLDNPIDKKKIKKIRIKRAKNAKKYKQTNQANLVKEETIKQLKIDNIRLELENRMLKHEIEKLEKNKLTIMATVQSHRLSPNDPSDTFTHLDTDTIDINNPPFIPLEFINTQLMLDEVSHDINNLTL